MTFTDFDPAIIADPTHTDYKLHYLKSVIGDKVCDAGPYPDGGNFEDEELQNFLTVGGGKINSAFIQACRALAAAWTSFGLIEENEAGKFSAISVGRQWQARAEEAMETPIDSATGKKWQFEVY